MLRSSCLTLAGQPGATLADIPRLLGDAAYRQRATAGIRDPVLSGFWDWYESLSDAHRSFITGPLMNKLRAFLLRRFVRETVGAASSSFDMAQVLDGGLCLVRLPKGQLGEDTTRLLGSVILARAWQTATHRARTGQAARSDCTLYIDECHNFLSLPHGMEDMLAEARSYRMSLVLVHQNLAQLSRELREGISANARSKIIFTCSPEDAHQLERHVQPSLSAHDLSHLGAFQACARLVAGSAEQPAFTMRTLPLPRRDPGTRGDDPASSARLRRRGHPRPSRHAGTITGRRPEARARARDPGGRRIMSKVLVAVTPPAPRRPPGSGRPRRPRPRLSGNVIAVLASRLTPRDRWLLRMLAEHQVLTSSQIAQLAYPSGDTARHRLIDLWRLRAVDRAQPWAPSGSAPMHYVLGDGGAAILAAEHGVTPAGIGYRRERALAILASPRLNHTTGLNAVMTALVAAARTRPGCALTAWWPERRCQRQWGDFVRPDAYGRWQRERPRHRLLPRVRPRHRASPQGRRQARRIRRARRGHRDHHPGAVLVPDHGAGSERPRSAEPRDRPCRHRGRDSMPG